MLRRPVLAHGLLLALLLLLPACGEADKTGEQGTPYSPPPYATPYAGGADATGGLDAELQAEVKAALAKGRELLLAAQDESGAWGDAEAGMPPNGGHTALALHALVAVTPRTQVAGDAAIAKGLAFLAGLQKEDGSIFDNPAFVNYMTSAAIGAFALARVPAYADVQVRARDYLAASQIGDDEGDPSYGGFPYKQDQGQPADLSNVQFAVTALADAGLPKDHVVWTRLQTYLARVQNRSETNTYRTEAPLGEELVPVVSGDDDGAIYYPGNSKAGLVERSDGTYEARSYGSMTYALLKCLLLSGVDVDDPRVVGALGWITRNFVATRNPGFEHQDDAEKAGQQGYYYYVYTLARTLAEFEAITKKPLEVKDAAGKVHNWRAELARALLDRRRADGWWLNEASERWMEGAPVLASSYALVALAELDRRFR